MDDTLFETLTDAYGADMQRWPEAHRATGAEHAAKHAQARELFKRAARLDNALSALPAGKASEALKARLLAQAIPTDTFIVWFGREMRRYAALFLIMAAAGAWAGSTALGGELLRYHASDALFDISALSE